MATPEQIAEVRENIAEPDDRNGFGDELLSGLIDESDVPTASAICWRRKAAGFQHLVNVSEAGASHSFSDLQKKALDMAATFDAEALKESASANGYGRAKVHIIDRR